MSVSDQRKINARLRRPDDYVDLVAPQLVEELTAMEEFILERLSDSSRNAVKGFLLETENQHRLGEKLLSYARLLDRLGE